ncbi:MAG: AAA family ATPase [Eubacterium sp.]|nr:AAA family ATPase [Eubacterium sp.]
MNKKRIILVEEDENYISNLEMMLISHEESLISLELISSRDYLNSFMAKPQVIDCLVIDEKMMTDSISRQNIGRLFVLTESTVGNIRTAASSNMYERTSSMDLRMMQSMSKVEYVDKYGGVKELFHKIIGALGLPADDRKIELSSGKKNTSTIMVTSQLGGAGKTRAAFSIALRLAELNRSVIYISLDEIQRNHILAGINDSISEGMERVVMRKDDNLISFLDQMIYHGRFDYFLPWNNSRVAMGIEADQYIYLFNVIKKTGRYDFIILDDNGSFDLFSQEMMAVSDRIINVLKDDKISRYAYEKFKNEIRTSERNKIMVVKNMCAADIDEEVVDTIPAYNFYNENWVEDLSKTDILKNTAMLLV